MFRILHLSDLHVRESTAWSTDAILKDAKRIILEQADAENFDVVAFTGDIAFSGKASEYELAASWLEDLCLSTSGLNINPKELLLVPGNHDVDRNLISPVGNAIEQQLAEAQSQAAVATHYDNVESRELLLRRHKAYFEFCRSITESADIASAQWSRIFEYAGRKIRFDGINSSWLCRGNDDHRRLLVGQSQLTELIRRRDDSDFAITLMHHPIADLMEFDERNTVDYLRQNTDLLLRGHLHNQEIVNSQSNTGGYLELAAGALFEGHERRNCFSVIDIGDDLATVYVRTFIWDRGRWIKDRNPYQTDDGVGVFELTGREKTADTPSGGSIPCRRLDANSSGLPENDDAASEDKLAFDSIRNFPKFQYQPTQQDLAIRHDQLADAISQLRSKRLLYVGKEAGAKYEGFLACLVQEVQKTSGDSLQLYLTCTGVGSGEELQDAFGLVSLETVTTFAAELRECGPCILILDDLDDLPKDLVEPRPTMNETVQALVDFCPDLFVVRVSALPYSSCGNALRIGALDPPDTRAYFLASGSNGMLQSPADYARVHRVTGGLPVLLDDVIDALGVTNLEGALAQVESQPVRDSKELPESIVREIDLLTHSESDELLRAKRLLQILSVLERGESLTTIRRLDPRHPIWPRQASYLQSRGLIDIVDTTPRYCGAIKSMYPTEGDKILRVPRLVRNRVLELMDSDERIDLIKKATQLYFSDDWRQGLVRMRRRIAFGSEISTHQSGNEMTILRFLANSPDEYFAEDARSSAFALGLSYINQLKTKGFYGEAYEAARDFLGFAADASYAVDEDAVCLLQKLAGSSARMIGEKEACVEFISDALPRLRKKGEKEKLSDALTVLAMALKSLGRNEDATATANEILEIAPRESSDYFQAKALLAELETDRATRVRKLKPLKTRARNLGYHTVADNITLELATECDDTEEKLKLLRDVKSRGDKEYNYVRATIRRVETLLDSGRHAEITSTDQRDLWRSYQLAYSQRLAGIFDWCHRVCWQYVKVAGTPEQLVDLFMFSSFVWRINGDTQSEEKYASLLQSEQTSAARVGPLARLALYLANRLNILREKQVVLHS